MNRVTAQHNPGSFLRSHQPVGTAFTVDNAFFAGLSGGRGAVTRRSLSCRASAKTDMPAEMASKRHLDQGGAALLQRDAGESAQTPRLDLRMKATESLTMVPATPQPQQRHNKVPTTQQRQVPQPRHNASDFRRRQAEVDAWHRLASDVSMMTRTVQLVQWYPGHIAKAERDLKEQLKWVDIVLEVRDARIPLATTHPQIDDWIGNRPKVVVVNREDMISASDRTAWATHFGRQGIPFCFTDGRRGGGILKLTRAAMSVSKGINTRRKDKGLLPRAVRAAVIGFPNVGKSAIINRLVRKRACDSAPRPGVTREVRWVRLGEGLELLDAPGVLPMRIADQAAAARLAMCNDIGQAAYAVSGVASILVSMLQAIPGAGPGVLESRYKVSAEAVSGEEFLEALADRLFMGDVDQASHRVLKDFRSGALGWTALERPPQQLIDTFL